MELIQKAITIIDEFKINRDSEVSKRFENYNRDKDNLITVLFSGYAMVYNSQTNGLYNVARTSDGKYICDCPDFSKNGQSIGLCKHIIAAKIEAQGQLKQERKLNLDTGNYIRIVLGYKVGYACDRMEAILHMMRRNSKGVDLAYLEGKMQGLRYSLKTLRSIR